MSLTVDYLDSIRVSDFVVKDCAAADGKPACEHLIILTDEGELFERFSTDGPGVWSKIPLPKASDG